MKDDTQLELELEQEIQDKGLTAPRVTPADIEASIVSEHYFTAMDGVYGRAGSPGIVAGVPVSSPLDLLTFCVLVLRNGFTVTGESACASPENFDAELGRKIARQKAVEKIWPLMGYTLREDLHRAARGDENQHREAQEAARRDVLLDLCEIVGVDDPGDLTGRVAALAKGCAS